VFLLIRKYTFKKVFGFVFTREVQKNMSGERPGDYDAALKRARQKLKGEDEDESEEHPSEFAADEAVIGPVQDPRAAEASQNTQKPAETEEDVEYDREVMDEIGKAIEAVAAPHLSTPDNRIEMFEKVADGVDREVLEEEYGESFETFENRAEEGGLLDSPTSNRRTEAVQTMLTEMGEYFEETNQELETFYQSLDNLQDTFEDIEGVEASTKMARTTVGPLNEEYENLERDEKIAQALETFSLLEERHSSNGLMAFMMDVEGYDDETIEQETGITNPRNSIRKKRDKGFYEENGSLSKIGSQVYEIVKAVHDAFGQAKGIERHREDRIKRQGQKISGRRDAYEGSDDELGASDLVELTEELSDKYGEKGSDLVDDQNFSPMQRRIASAVSEAYDGDEDYAEVREAIGNLEEEYPLEG
jgi:hypothetical protein